MSRRIHVHYPAHLKLTKRQTKAMCNIANTATVSRRNHRRSGLLRNTPKAINIGNTTEANRVNDVNPPLMAGTTPRKNAQMHQLLSSFQISGKEYKSKMKT